MPSTAQTAQMLAADMRRRIATRLPDYFPDLADVPGCRVEQVRHGLTADNTLLLFSLSCPEKGFNTHVLCKRLLVDRTAPEAARRELDMLRLLHGHPLFMSNDFHVPRVIDYFPDVRVVVMEYVHATRLTDILRSTNRLGSSKGKSRLCRLAERSGHLLKTLHTITDRHEHATLDERMMINLAQRSLGAFDRISGNLFHSPEQAMQRRGMLQKAFERAGELSFPLVRVHGDYYPGNILVADESLWLIDFAFSKPGIAHEDAARFTLCLELINPYPGNPLYNPRLIPLLQQYFFKGYGGDAFSAPKDALLFTLYRVRGILFHCRRRTPQSEYGIGRKLYFSALTLLYRRKLDRALTRVEQLTEVLAT